MAEAYRFAQVPQGGEKIRIDGSRLDVPANPILP